MEKRKTDVTPLKKITYTAAEEEIESAWWTPDQYLTLQKKQFESLHEQMSEYKRRTKELEDEKHRILNAKIDTALEKTLDSTKDEHIKEKILSEFKTDLLNCTEHMLQVSQLRQRLNTANRRADTEISRHPPHRHPAGDALHTEDTPSEGRTRSSSPESSPGAPDAHASVHSAHAQTPNTPSPSKPATEAASLHPSAQIPAEEIEQCIAKIDALENRIEAALSKNPPNYHQLVKALEMENAELLQTNTEMRARIEDEVKKSVQQREENVQKERTSEETKRRLKTTEEAAEETKHRADKEKEILQSSICELHSVLHRISSEIVDQTRDLGKENRERSCTEECQKRMKALEDKEIDRTEEISFLVRKYIDTSKENTALKTKLESKTHETRAQALPSAEATAPGRDAEDRLQEECSRLVLELERSKLDYLERKSSAQYHKRKSVQFEAELKASRKTATDLEKANQALQQKIEQARTQKIAENKTKELEVYEKMVRCAVCSTNIKNAVLKKCMHLMCRECIEERYITRQRTCPLCGVVFLMSDVSQVYL